MSPIQADIKFVRLAPALGEDKAPADPPATWDFNAIGQLLDEVRRAGGIIPSRYYPEDDTPNAYTAVRKARGKLWQKISLAFTWGQLHYKLTSEAIQKKRPKVAKKIKDQARRLSESLQEDPTLMHHLAMEMGLSPLTGVGMGDFSRLLEVLEEAAGKMANMAVNSAPFPQLKMTPQELLFSRLLKAYRDGLDADPALGYSASYHDPKGPFVAFAKAAHKLAGKDPPSSDALESAIKAARGTSSGED